MTAYNQDNVRKNSIPTTKGYASIYAHSVEPAANSRLLFVSGQIGVTAEGVTLGDFKAQFEQAIANMTGVLEGADMSLADVVKFTFFVTRPDHLVQLREIRQRLLAYSTAVTTLVVAGLATPELLVEVEAIAARGR